MSPPTFLIILIEDHYFDSLVGEQVTRFFVTRCSYLVKIAFESGKCGPYSEVHAFTDAFRLGMDCLCICSSLMTIPQDFS